jgi:hypothetical protein
MKKTADTSSPLEAEREHVRDILDAMVPLANSSKILSKQEEKLDWETENERLNLENRREKREIRRRWNLILTLLVILGFAFSYLMITLIGLGIMKFENNAFAVPSVVAAGVIQTYGLAKLAIKYFFSEDKREQSPKSRDPEEQK